MSDLAVIGDSSSALGFLEEEVESLRESLKPAIMVIPSSTRSEGLGILRIKGVVEKAVGTELISGEENGRR